MSFKGIIEQVILPNIFQPLVALILGVALLYFLIGVVKYIRASSDDKERAAGRQMMAYGIVALFVMVAVWGLVNVLLATFPGLDLRIPKPPSS